MATQVFPTVWYRPDENRWRDLSVVVLAYNDVGSLTLAENMIVFSGNQQTVAITNIRSVTFGKQGRDFVNNWVRIEYGDNTAPSVAFFADGSLRGWGGIFGGTKRILRAVQEHIAGNVGASQMILKS